MYRERRVVRLDVRPSVITDRLDEMGAYILTSTTVSDTFGDGTTEYVHIILSGNSSRMFEMSSVPIPAPVPPPSEWVIWKPAWHEPAEQR